MQDKVTLAWRNLRRSGDLGKDRLFHPDQPSPCLLPHTFIPNPLPPPLSQLIAEVRIDTGSGAPHTGNVSWSVNHVSVPGGEAGKSTAKSESSMCNDSKK